MKIIEQIVGKPRARHNVLRIYVDEQGESEASPPFVHHFIANFFLGWRCGAMEIGFHVLA